jgi:hypothetical protein
VKQTQLVRRATRPCDSDADRFPFAWRRGRRLWSKLRQPALPGRGRPISAKLPAGRHTVTLTNDEFKIRRQLTVQIAANEIVRRKLDFAR